jgi:uncharacterized membrane protein
MLIILVIVIVGFYLLKENGNLPNQKENQSHKTLKERYVNDEIDEEEYLKKKKILED